VTHPTVGQAHAAAAAMGRMHDSHSDFTLERPNTLGPQGWKALFERCGSDLDSIQPGLYGIVGKAVDKLLAAWPAELPRAAIHADLFPDNVLMLSERVTGLIDFYFACTDLRAYDLAVMHGAWAFDGSGAQYDAAVGRALIDGYTSSFTLLPQERAALPVLAEGAALRFLLTRAWDWLNTPADAMVTRKDPLAYLRRLEFYAANGGALFA
jgi:homoserine kinase type II